MACWSWQGGEWCCSAASSAPHHQCQYSSLPSLSIPGQSVSSWPSQVQPAVLPIPAQSPAAGEPTGLALATAVQHWPPPRAQPSSAAREELSRRDKATLDSELSCVLAGRHRAEGSCWHQDPLGTVSPPVPWACPAAVLCFPKPGGCVCPARSRSDPVLSLLCRNERFQEAHPSEDVRQQHS